MAMDELLYCYCAVSVIVWCPGVVVCYSMSSMWSSVETLHKRRTLFFLLPILCNIHDVHSFLQRPSAVCSFSLNSIGGNILRITPKDVSSEQHRAHLDMPDKCDYVTGQFQFQQGKSLALKGDLTKSFQWEVMGMRGTATDDGPYFPTLGKRSLY